MRNYGSVSLTSVPKKKVMEQIIPETISKYRKMIWSSQFGFMKIRTGLTNMIPFCSKTSSVDEDEALYDIYLGFIKAFDRVSSNTLMKKMDEV